ncbi:hypothetical protein [Pseudaminobacter soli (ex Li et al. 2025)]|uniref:Uncharacterized protein n=1 Tax=Pseudaminobacter soli (ex Li et al. 2025) TaxID=1295366 RepID=A0A2P7S006_9HYPH|nr:hypothetical protein [Mesorhizobium soli]PSJ55809.1 hypothetical protein C7I85_26345 [Mesorhizobium soli]
MSSRKKPAQPVNAGPEAILPLTDFRGDPWGTGNENAVAFRAGILSSPVPADFATKVSSEGKATRIGQATSDPEEIAARQAATTIAADTAPDQSAEG